MFFLRGVHHNSSSNPKKNSHRVISLLITIFPSHRREKIRKLARFLSLLVFFPSTFDRSVRLDQNQIQMKIKSNQITNASLGKISVDVVNIVIEMYCCSNECMMRVMVIVSKGVCFHQNICQFTKPKTTVQISKLTHNQDGSTVSLALFMNCERGVAVAHVELSSR